MSLRERLLGTAASRARPQWDGVNAWLTWPGKGLLQKPGPWCRTKARLGRRGAMLLLLGLTYVLLGYRETITLTAPHARGAWLFLFPDEVRAAVWIVTGLIAVGYALGRQHRERLPFARPRWWWGTDAVGWLSLYVMPALVFTSYAGSFFLWFGFDYILGTVPPTLPLHGDETAWSSAVLRIPFIVTVLVCSGWQENPPRGDCR